MEKMHPLFPELSSWKVLKGAKGKKLLQVHQKARLFAVVRAAWVRSAFWRERWTAAGMTESDLESSEICIRFFPILSEADAALSVEIDAGQDAWKMLKSMVSEPISWPPQGGRDIFVVCSTSHASVSVYAPQEAVIVRNQIAPLSFERKKVALITPARKHHGVAALFTLTNPDPRSNLLIDSASNSLDEIVETLNDWQPDVVKGYPSIIARLAVEQLRHRLRISPKAIITLGEILTATQKRLIQSAWKTCPKSKLGISQLYGLTTFCSTGKQHFREDLFIVEVREDGSELLTASPKSSNLLVEGELVVTSLYRQHAPFVRVALGDRITIGSPDSCMCGLPFSVLERIWGESRSCIILPGANSRVYASQLATLDLDGVIQYQIVQSSPLSVLVKVVLDPNSAVAVIDKVKQYFSLKLPGLSIAILEVAEIVDLKTKTPLIITSS